MPGQPEPMCAVWPPSQSKLNNFAKNKMSILKTSVNPSFNLFASYQRKKAT